MGTVTYTSTPGQGTTFTLTVPLARIPNTDLHAQYTRDRRARASRPPMNRAEKQPRGRRSQDALTQNRIPTLQLTKPCFDRLSTNGKNPTNTRPDPFALSLSKGERRMNSDFRRLLPHFHSATEQRLILSHIPRIAGWRWSAAWTTCWKRSVPPPSLLSVAEDAGHVTLPLRLNPCNRSPPSI